MIRTHIHITGYTLITPPSQTRPLYAGGSHIDSGINNTGFQTVINTTLLPSLGSDHLPWTFTLETKIEKFLKQYRNYNNYDPLKYCRETANIIPAAIPARDNQHCEKLIEELKVGITAALNIHAPLQTIQPSKKLSKETQTLLKIRNILQKTARHERQPQIEQDLIQIKQLVQINIQKDEETCWLNTLHHERDYHRKL
nr:unnamed protein product [Callosobruchus chinensis]